MENKFELMVLPNPGQRPLKVTYAFPSGLLVAHCALPISEIERSIQMRAPLEGKINDRMTVIVNPWHATHIIIEDVL